MKFLEKLMEVIIDEGIQTPKVQVERYISPILNMFLPELLSKIYNNKYVMIIPEFPIKKGRIQNSNNNQSTNIDYLLYNETKSIFTFVELKTDSTSFKKSQLKIYQDLQEICNNTTNVAFGQLLKNDLEDITKATKLKSKYQYILGQWKDDFNDINNMEIVYLVPKTLKSKIEDNLVLSFNDLPKNINLYNEEWQIIRTSLLKLDEN
jgi:hypothetical protein